MDSQNLNPDNLSPESFVHIHAPDATGISHGDEREQGEATQETEVRIRFDTHAHTPPSSPSSIPAGVVKPSNLDKETIERFNSIRSVLVPPPI